MLSLSGDRLLLIGRLFGGFDLGQVRFGILFKFREAIGVVAQYGSAVTTPQVVVYLAQQVLSNDAVTS